ncbi:hypothetical protein BKA82DRAFT_3928764, partial [Pisolithus tinctorius]
SKRQTADDRIRYHTIDVAAACPLETLYAVSTAGMKLCFYCLNTQDGDAEIAPAATPHHP